MATIAEAAAHIDLGERRFYELLEGDVIERCQPGEYNLDHVRVTYIRHIRKIGAGRGAEKGIDLASERARLAREQTEAAAFKNAIARGEYVAIEEAGRQMEADYGLVRQRILAMPGKLADALEGMSREEREAAILAEVNEALNELSEPAHLLKLEVARAVPAGRGGGKNGNADEPAD